MPTLQEFLAEALTDAGVINPAQNPSGPALDFARRKHATLVQSWASSRLRLFFVPEVQYALVAKGVYQIGPGAADFDTSAGLFTRPLFIQAGSVVIGTARRWSLNILTRPQWDLNNSRTISDPDGPLDLFYDFAVPISTINVAPIPTGAKTIFLSQWNPLKTFAAGDEQLELLNFYPPEYLEPMRLGLAMTLGIAYKLPVNQDLIPQFQTAIQTLERINNDKLSGAFGTSRTLDGPVKGDGSPVGGAAVQAGQ